MSPASSAACEMGAVLRRVVNGHGVCASSELTFASRFTSPLDAERLPARAEHAARLGWTRSATLHGGSPRDGVVELQLPCCAGSAQRCCVPCRGFAHARRCVAARGARARQPMFDAAAPGFRSQSARSRAPPADFAPADFVFTGGGDATDFAYAAAGLLLWAELHAAPGGIALFSSFLSDAKALEAASVRTPQAAEQPTATTTATAMTRHLARATMTAGAAATMMVATMSTLSARGLRGLHSPFPPSRVAPLSLSQGAS